MSHMEESNYSYDHNEDYDQYQDKYDSFDEDFTVYGNNPIDNNDDDYEYDDGVFSYSDY